MALIHIDIRRTIDLLADREADTLRDQPRLEGARAVPRVASVMSPTSVVSVFGVEPLREFGEPSQASSPPLDAW